MLDILRIPELCRKIIPGVRSAHLLRACSQETRGLITPDLMPQRQSRQCETANILSWRRGAIVRCGTFTYHKVNPERLIIHDGEIAHRFSCVQTTRNPPGVKITLYERRYWEELLTIKRLFQEIFGNTIIVMLEPHGSFYYCAFVYVR